MSHFIFPSDQDRADNPELERVCDQLEQCLVEDERLRSALADRDALITTCREKLEKAEVRSKGLTQQLEEAQQERNVTGLQIRAALRGGKRKDEAPNDGRMEAVRAMVAQNKQIHEAADRLSYALVHTMPDDCRKDFDEAFAALQHTLLQTPAQSLAAVRVDAVESFKSELVKSVKPIFIPHVEGVCAVVTQRIRNGEA